MNQSESILIFASSLASCIGRNKYAPQSEAFHATWVRLRPDAPVTVDAPVLNVDTDAVASTVAAAPTHATVAAVVKDVEQKVEQTVAETWSAPQVPVHYVDQAKASRTEEAVTMLQARIETDTQLAPEVKDDLLQRASKQRKVLQEQKQAVSAAQCSYGTVQEAASRTQYEAERSDVVAHDNKFHKRWLGFTRTGRRWGVGGRVDGVDSEGRVVEIKNRMRCFFRTVPDYEEVQLQAYMQLLDVEEGVLVQQFGGAQRRTIVTRDREQWDGAILPALEDFVNTLDAFLDSPDWQAEWVAATKQERDALLRHWHTLLAQ